MTYTLVELPVASMSHLWLISTVHPVDVVAFDLLDLVHGHVACKGNLMLVRGSATNAQRSMRKYLFVTVHALCGRGCCTGLATCHVEMCE